MTYVTGLERGRKAMRSAFVIAASLAVSLSMSACWPQRGFDAGRSYWNPSEKHLTSGNVHRLTVEWDAVVGPEDQESRGVSGLMAVGDAVFATAAGGVVARLHDESGDVAWRQVLDPGQTSPPPAMDMPTWYRDRVFVKWACCRAGIGGSYLLDPRTGDAGGADPGGSHGMIFDVAVARGALATNTTYDGGLVDELAWRYGAITVYPGIGSQPGNRFAILGDRVMWTYGEDAVSFGPECRPSPDPALSCAPEWQTPLGEEYAEPAAVGTDSVAYTDWSGTLTVLDAATGEVRWRAELGDVTDVPRTVVARRTIVVGTSDGRLAAFPAGGCGADVCEPDWETEATGAPVWLAAAGDVVFAASWSTGEVRAFDLDGCREATCEPLVELDVGDRISGEPIVHDGRLIVGTSAGHVVAFGLPRPSS